MNTSSTKFSVEQVVDATLGQFGTELNSGSIAKAVNAALLVLEVKENKTGDDGKPVVVDYQVTPQMMNNYGRNGMFDTVKRESMTGIVFSAADVRAWMIRFLTNKVNGVVTRGKGVPAADVAEAVRAKLGKPNTVIVADDAAKTAAPAVKAAPATPAKK
jgi:hypothetical protein